MEGENNNSPTDGEKFESHSIQNSLMTSQREKRKKLAASIGPNSPSQHGSFVSNRDQTNAQEQVSVEQLIAELEKPNHQMLAIMLQKYQDEGNQISFAEDTEGFNLLHHAVLSGIPGKVKFLLDALPDAERSKYLLQWVNSKTNKDKFTPLHFASFKSDLESCYVLLRAGADKEAVNAFGLNMVHVAAQNDATTTLYLFWQLGVDISKEDIRGSTPVHWACYCHCEVALNYLLAWGPKINAQDKQGQTALHLAVKTLDQVESCRPLRFLLHKGAEKDIQDNEGKIPMDLVNEETVKTDFLRSEARKLLGPPSNMECIGLTPPTSNKRSSKNLILQLFLFFVVVAIELSTTFKFIRYEGMAVNLAFVITCLTSLAFASCKDPGFLKKPKKGNFMYMVEAIESTQLCAQCFTIRTPRSRHCATCNKCVERFDHHCPWINNCVGLKNHRAFLIFLISMWGTLALSCFQALTLIAKALDRGSLPASRWYGNKIMKYQVTEIQFYVSLTVQVFITIIFLFGVTLLLYIQLRNFMMAKTSVEAMSRGMGVHANEPWLKFINSGITNDKRIIYDSRMVRGGSLGEDMREQMSMLEQDDRNGGYRNSFTMPEVQKEQERFDRANSCMKCCFNFNEMCCNQTVRSQERIFQQNLGYLKIDQDQMTSKQLQRIIYEWKTQKQILTWAAEEYKRTSHNTASQNYGLDPQTEASNAHIDGPVLDSIKDEDQDYSILTQDKLK